MFGKVPCVDEEEQRGHSGGRRMLGMGVVYISVLCSRALALCNG